MRCIPLFFVSLLVPCVALSQVSFISPLPDGILQVHGDHADLRLRVLFPVGYQNFSIKLGSDRDTSSPLEGWSSVTTAGGAVDTLLTVPKSLRNYSLYWRADSAGVQAGGIIAGLTPGHIIGIAGQSNAQGFCYEMIEPANGDIRMLVNNSAWQPAHEPTGGVAGGPWIVMSNLLYQMIGDTLPVGIVNTAIGGTGLTIADAGGQWIRNAANPEDSSIYGNALHRFRAAGSEIECLCWIQGESDGNFLIDPNIYRADFAQLVRGFESDLADTFAVFHLQISGYSGLGAPVAGFPIVREAERVLPPSTLVGTGLGLALENYLHYNVPSLWSIGRMFAGAILEERYGIQTPMYPPLVPDSVARLGSVTDGSIIGHYCFSLGWNRGGIPASLSIVRPTQYFAIHKDGQEIDPTMVWYRIDPLDSSHVLIGLTNDSISPGHDWRVTYDATSAADLAPLAAIDPVSRDTIFATAFYELPVAVPSGPVMGVKEFSVNLLVPNPALHAINCYILAFKHEMVSVELWDNRGVVLHRQTNILDEGTQDVTIPTDGLPSGNYWIVLRGQNGAGEVQKAVVIH
jgi:hypothetical protein